MSWRFELSHCQRFYWKVAEVQSVKTVDDIKWYGFVGLCVRWTVWVCLQYSEDGNTHSVYQQAWSWQCSPPPASSCLSSVFLFTPSSFDCYSQLAESTFSTCAIQRYFSTSLYRFLVYIFYDMCYITLMVNGYISLICKSIWWLCTVSIKGMGLSCSTEGGWRCSAKRTGNSQPHSRKFLHPEKKKQSMFCCEREVPMEWNPL